VHKILICHKGQLYKFLNWEFQDDRDGSLYIVFDRIGKGPGTTWGSRTGNIPTTYAKEDENAKFRISYHPCGHVRFHNIAGTRKSIHCEPIYAITGKQPLAFISIPNVESLALAEQTEDKDAIFDWPDQAAGRVTFWIELGPSALEKPFESNNPPLAAVTYDPWFTLFISLGILPIPLPENVSAQAVIKVVPDEDFVTERVSQEQAVIAFHQRKHGVKHQAVTEFKPVSGVYRIVFAVPMRVPPKLTVEFFDADLSAEITHCTTYEVRFKVKGRGGYNNEWVPIKGFTLDAEL
jgi:hypothetical protein